ncbi:MAG: zinc finger domain-containing protein [Leucobacter sp.]
MSHPRGRSSHFCPRCQRKR